jgi:hypothetical protein
MPATALRILAIGELLPATRDLLRRLEERGWGSQSVRGVREAKDVLGIFDYDVVLASEILRDGGGYDVADSVAVHSRTLLVGVALSETWLWLPVVERGVNVLGKRGLNAQMLESELVNLLSPPAREGAREHVTQIARKPAVAPENPAPQRSTTMLRRKYRDRDRLPMER